MATLAEIRARLAASDKRATGNFAENGVYPHWNIAENSSARVRFVPDGNTKNDFFWQERLLINLEFPGIKGQIDSKKLTIKVPCIQMWGEACPILAQVRPMWNDVSLKDTASKYWSKKSYLMSGFVRENPIGEDASKERENPIRRFVINPQIFTLIKSALMDPEMEEMPTDYTRGLDFIISKTAKGAYADYTSSKWARKESPLTQDERDAIEKHGLFDLSTFLPKKPTEVELKAMVEMFEASIAGQAYDLDRWGAYFKPYNVDVPGGNKTEQPGNKTEQAAPQHTDHVKASAPITSTVTEAASKSAGSSKAEDILAKIRNRNK